MKSFIHGSGFHVSPSLNSIFVHAASLYPSSHPSVRPSNEASSAHLSISPLSQTSISRSPIRPAFSPCYPSFQPNAVHSGTFLFAWACGRHSTRHEEVGVCLHHRSLSFFRFGLFTKASATTTCKPPCGLDHWRDTKAMLAKSGIRKSCQTGRTCSTGGGELSQGWRMMPNDIASNGPRFMMIVYHHSESEGRSLGLVMTA